MLNYVSDNTAVSGDLQVFVLPTLEQRGQLLLSNCRRACLNNHIVTNARKRPHEFIAEFENRRCMVDSQNLASESDISNAYNHMSIDTFGLPYELLDDDERESIDFVMRGRFDIVRHGKVVKANYWIPDKWHQIKKSQAKRGKVSKTFSFKSRLRLKESISAYDFTGCDPKSLVAITLTFPADVADISQAQNALRVLYQRLGRKFDASGWWKQEFTRRGRVHFHLLAVFPQAVELGDYWVFDHKGELRPYSREKKHYIKRQDGVKGFRYYLQDVWSTYVAKYFDVDDLSVFHSSVEADYVKSPERIASYYSDYLACCGNGHKDKEYQNTCPAWCDNGGRWWGTFNRGNIIVALEHSYISFAQWVQIQDIFEDYVKSVLPEYGKDSPLGAVYLNGVLPISKDIEVKLNELIDKIMSDNDIQDAIDEYYKTSSNHPYFEQIKPIGLLSHEDWQRLADDYFSEHYIGRFGMSEKELSEYRLDMYKNILIFGGK